MSQYSDEANNENAVPAVPNIPSTHGVRRIKSCSGTIVTAGGLAVGAKIYLFTLPKGARLKGGNWGNDAAFSGAGVTLNIGWADAEEALASGLDCASLNLTAIGKTKALNYDAVLSAAKDVYAVVVGDVIVNGGIFHCDMDYVM
jgi:hypothetical protein